MSQREQFDKSSASEAAFQEWLNTPSQPMSCAEWSDERLRLAFFAGRESIPSSIERAPAAKSCDGEQQTLVPGSARDYRAKWLEAVDTITTLGRLESALKEQLANARTALTEQAHEIAELRVSVRSARTSTERDLMYALEHALDSAGQAEGDCPECIDARALLARLQSNDIRGSRG